MEKIDENIQMIVADQTDSTNALAPLKDITTSQNVNSLLKRFDGDGLTPGKLPSTKRQCSSGVKKTDSSNAERFFQFQQELCSLKSKNCELEVMARSSEERALHLTQQNSQLRCKLQEAYAYSKDLEDELSSFQDQNESVSKTIKSDQCVKPEETQLEVQKLKELLARRDRQIKDNEIQLQAAKELATKNSRLEHLVQELQIQLNAKKDNTINQESHTAQLQKQNETLNAKWRARLFPLQNELDKTKKMMAELEDEKKLILVEKNKLVKQYLAELGAKEAVNKVAEDLKTSSDRLRKDLEEAVAQTVQKNMVVDELKKYNTALEFQAKVQRFFLNSLRGERSSLQKKQECSTQDFSQILKQNEQLLNQCASHAKETESHELSKAKLMNEKAQMLADLKNAQAEVKSLNFSKSKVEDQLQFLQLKYDRDCAKLKSAEDTNKVLSANLSTLKKEQNVKESLLSKANDKLKDENRSVSDTLSSRESEVERLAKSVQALKTERAKLSDDIAAKDSILQQVLKKLKKIESGKPEAVLSELGLLVKTLSKISESGHDQVPRKPTVTPTWTRPRDAAEPICPETPIDPILRRVKEEPCPCTPKAPVFRPPRVVSTPKSSTASKAPSNGLTSIQEDSCPSTPKVTPLKSSRVSKQQNAELKSAKPLSTFKETAHGLPSIQEESMDDSQILSPMPCMNDFDEMDELDGSKRRRSLRIHKRALCTPLKGEEDAQQDKSASAVKRMKCETPLRARKETLLETPQPKILASSENSMSVTRRGTPRRVTRTSIGGVDVKDDFEMTAGSTNPEPKSRWRPPATPMHVSQLPTKICPPTPLDVICEESCTTVEVGEQVANSCTIHIKPPNYKAICSANCSSKHQFKVSHPTPTSSAGSSFPSAEVAVVLKKVFAEFVRGCVTPFVFASALVHCKNQSVENLLVPLLQCVVAAESCIVGEQFGSNGRLPGNHGVLFTTFDFSTVDMPKDTRPDSVKPVMEVIVLLNKLINEEDSLLAKVKNNSTGADAVRLYDFYTALCSVTLLNEDSIKDIFQSCERQQVCVPVSIADFKGAASFYATELSFVLNGAETDRVESPIRLQFATLLCTLFRFHLRRMFNPPPLHLTTPSATFRPKDYPKGVRSKVWQLCKPVPVSGVSHVYGAAADGCMSSIISNSLCSINDWIIAESQMKAFQKTDSYVLDQLVVKFHASQIMACHAIRFLRKLFEWPGISEEIVGCGGWTEIESLMGFLQRVATCEDAHQLLLGDAESFLHWITEVYSECSDLEKESTEILKRTLVSKTFDKEQRTEIASLIQAAAKGHMFPTLSKPEL